MKSFLRGMVVSLGFIGGRNNNRFLFENGESDNKYYCLCPGYSLEHSF